MSDLYNTNGSKGALSFEPIDFTNLSSFSPKFDPHAGLLSFNFKPNPYTTNVGLSFNRPFSQTTPLDTENGTGNGVVKNGMKNLFQGIKSELPNIGNTILNPAMQNQIVGMMGEVENTKGTDTAFAVGDQISNMLPGKYGAIAKGVMLGAKMLNSAAGKKTNTFSIDTSTVNQIGSSYGDVMKDINEAALKSNKKYGLFSNRSRKKANALIEEAQKQQNIMRDIAEDASDLNALANNDLNYLNYNFNILGGYDQRYMRAAKKGMKLQDKINFVKQKRSINNFINLNTKQLDWEPIISYKQGGNLEKDSWEPIIENIPEFQKGGKTRTLEELIAYAKEQNPRFIQRLSEEPRGIKFIDDEGNESEGSHYLESREEYVVPRIQEINGELKFLSPQEAIDIAMKSGNYLKMTPEEAILFAEKYKQGWPDFFKKFQKGGFVKNSDVPEIEETTQKNVIPEGALHKNKHHMEHAEGLTKKGIPVIDEEGNQQAEIELDEIIFTLEVTKKLEELYKKYYSEDYSQKEKDEFAISAGKLLVKEILFNTIDKTGLISKCEKGGVINEIS